MKITSEIKGHFLRLYQMAMTDGDFSAEEWKTLYQFALERGISEIELDRVLLSTTGSLDIPDSIETRVEYLYDLTRMIWADGKVTPDERETLIKYVRKFQFKEENVTALADYLIEKVRAGISKDALLLELK
ncbi:hypothetical protein [Phaeocystidibacter marisrubri]|uniref:TerB family tellurite resistance protein n=1 Tax=Phaeocystidibacter marisrubri TaxID=1577780 RepID=A0A6L3ZGN3_9FLAO|nr:hypothetical protein [Phaeocystidibacter marisrubri]KAB2817071.1 hypothetical protein F8C82_01355 [Phaeocystidibacter marisrubri]GGH76975.1 hypothetical protein GCM10011318_26050 [Phaeocystidibacter marisrubri]